MTKREHIDPKILPKGCEYLFYQTNHTVHRRVHGPIRNPLAKKKGSSAHGIFAVDETKIYQNPTLQLQDLSRSTKARILRYNPGLSRPNRKYSYQKYGFRKHVCRHKKKLRSNDFYNTLCDLTSRFSLEKHMAKVGLKMEYHAKTVVAEDLVKKLTKSFGFAPMIQKVNNEFYHSITCLDKDYKPMSAIYPLMNKIRRGQKLKYLVPARYTFPSTMSLRHSS